MRRIFIFRETLLVVFVLNSLNKQISSYTYPESACIGHWDTKLGGFHLQPACIQSAINQLGIVLSVVQKIVGFPQQLSAD